MLDQQSRQRHSLALSKRKPAARGKLPHVKPSDCCQKAAHPDHSAVLNRLRRAQGQLSGIEKMIRDRRYCLDILTQLKATGAAIHSVELSVFETHLRNCVREAVESKNPRDLETKIQELVHLMKQ